MKKIKNNSKKEKDFLDYIELIGGILFLSFFIIIIFLFISHKKSCIVGDCWIGSFAIDSFFSIFFFFSVPLAIILFIYSIFFIKGWFKK